MRSRPISMSVVVAMGLAAAFAAAPPAGAAPATVHPTAQVVSAKVSGKALHFVVEVTFSPPPQSTPSSACKGKVELTRVVNGQQSPSHWVGKLAPADGKCAAKVKGSLPAALANRKLSFTVSFDGNDGVAAFSHPSKLKLTPPQGGAAGHGAGPTTPAPVPTPAPASSPTPPLAVAFTAADGHWHSQSTGGGIFIDFTVDKGAIQHHFSSYGSSMLLMCDTEDGSPKNVGYLVGLVYDQDLALEPSGHFSGSYVREFEEEFPEYTLKFTIPQAVHGILAATTGEMTYEVTDASFSAAGHTQSGCDGSLTFNANKE